MRLAVITHSRGLSNISNLTTGLSATIALNGCLLLTRLREKRFYRSAPEFIHYLPNTSKESQFINEQTIVANRLQADRNPAQQELADWIRFSTKNADKYRDALTTASMEIEGIPGWVVRNFYNKDNVQILEEASMRQQLNQSIAIGENIQFILRSGYLKMYPEPISRRRPVDWFTRCVTNLK